jgi:hypothetical protein
MSRLALSDAASGLDIGVDERGDGATELGERGQGEQQQRTGGSRVCQYKAP